MGRKYAVLGKPVEHSISPIIQNAAFAYYGLDSSYTRILIESEEHLKLFLEERDSDFYGFNVTLPYKSCALKYVDSFSDCVKRAESLNLIRKESNGLLRGFSTDGYGFEMAIKKNFDSDPIYDKYFFVGCGGAVAACMSHLLEAGARYIGITNRTAFKAELLISKMKTQYPEANLFCVDIRDNERVSKLAEENYLFIQATSLGLCDKDALPIKEELLFRNMRIFDMIYTRTKLGMISAQIGCNYVSGADMLLYQGAKSFEIWTGLEAPIDVMREALLRSLAEKE